MKLVDFRKWIGIGMVLAALFVSGDHVAAADFYVAQNATGSGSGANSANCLSLASVNSTWPAHAGDTVHLIGVLTNALTKTGAGNPTNPITLLFEPNAKFSAPTWTGNIISGANYVTIDGGTNGIIEATANGTGLTFSNDNYSAINVSECSGVTVKHLTIRNLYVHQSGPDEAGGGVKGVLNTWNGGNNFSNMVVANCVFSDMSVGVQIGAAPYSANVIITNCTAYHCNWGGNAMDGGPGRMLTGLTVVHCHFYNWTNWDDVAVNNHHNGFYAWAESGGYLSNVTYTANYIGPGYGGTNYVPSGGNSSGLFISGNVYNVLVNNNIFDASDGSSPADGQLFLWLHSGTIATTENVFNNTFIGGLALNIYGGFASNLTTCVCENNAFFNAQHTILVYWNSAVTFISDTNNFYGSTSSTPFSSAPASSSWFTDYAGWQAKGYDTHSTMGNPLLTGSYVPQAGSALIGAGANLSSIFTTDYAGNPRPATGAWTIGAYQNASTPAPLVSLAASSANITQGQSTILTWSSVNAAKVVLNGIGAVPLTGSTNVSPSLTATYTATATSANGTNSASVSITVAPALPSPPSGLHPQ